MNHLHPHLHPHLRSLLRSGLPRQPFLPPVPPTGFTERVLSHAWRPDRSPVSTHSEPALISAIAWISCAMILCGGIFLLDQAPDPGLESHFSSTTRFIAQDFIP